MSKEQTNQILLCAFGALLLSLNKPFGELCRKWQIMFSGRDYGIWSFRLPAIIIGGLMLLLGVSFSFY
jgi:hypothetical protein